MERTFSWLGQNRRMSKDYERLPQSSEAFVYVGDLMGIAPTGKRVAVQQTHRFRVADGKVAEHWAVRDDLGMMRQLGVMPS